MSHTCRHCGNTIPEAEAADGWCESCGKKVPAPRPEPHVLVVPADTVVDTAEEAKRHLGRLGRWAPAVLVLVIAAGIGVAGRIDAVRNEAGLGDTRLVHGIPARAAGSGWFYFPNAKDRKTYFPLADADPAGFLAGATYEVPPGVTASVVSVGVRRANQNVGIDPTATTSRGITTLYADVFVPEGTWDLLAGETASPGPCVVRFTFPAANKRLEKLNSPPDGAPGTAVLGGKPEILLPAFVMTRARWWSVSLGIGSLLLLASVGLLAVALAAIAESEETGYGERIIALAGAGAFMLVLASPLVAALFAAGMADLFRLYPWPAAGVLAATNFAAAGLARLVAGSSAWTRAWAVTVCIPAALLLLAAGATLIESLAGYRGLALWATLALVPGMAVAVATAVVRAR